MPVNTSVFRGRPIETYLARTGTTASATLRVDEAMNRNIKFSGSLATATVITFPLGSNDAGVTYWIDNATTNGGSTSFKIAGALTETGDQLTVAQGTRVLVLFDGTKFVQQQATYTY